jgi:hypothetical protein
VTSQKLRPAAVVLPGFRVLNQLLSVIVFTVLFVVYLIVEVFLAMLVYMYLNLSHPYTFGWLTSLAARLLAAFTFYLERLSPDLANQAFRTLLGEIGPKAMLLLLIGLLVGAVARLVIWAVRSSFLRLRSA